MDKSSPGWRIPLGAAAEFADAGVQPPVDEEEGQEVDPKARGEYERRRGWRVDQGTLERFRELVAGFKGTQ
jgi:tRNA pseudouridine38-40 synthase